MWRQAKCIGLLAIITLAGCTTYPIYTPPTATTYKPETSGRTINRGFEEVWSSLIEYTTTTTTLFTVKDFEKDSGLLTLQFGSGNVEEFVNCGYLQSDAADSGPMVARFERFGLADLDGSMNVFIKPVSANVTQVKVNAQYILTANDGGSQTQVWSFDTGGSDSKTINGITVTCRPTHKAENTILSGVEKIAQTMQPKITPQAAPPVIPQEQPTLYDPSNPQTPPKVNCGPGKILVRNTSRGVWECLQDCGPGRVLMLDANNEWVCR